MSDTETRTVIVALPEGTPADWSQISRILTWHAHPACVPQVTYPVRRNGFLGWIHRWSTRHLLEPVRRHGVVRAAGGRVSRLDLPRLSGQALQQADLRWRTWNGYVARTTPTAKTWEDFHADHLRAPAKLSLEEARRRFESQPRVLAMLAYNSYPAVTHVLDPYELGAYQAGEAVYSAVHWQGALVGDALITPDGRFLAPKSSSVADRLRYLGEAAAIVHALTPRDHLVAVRAATAPVP